MNERAPTKIEAATADLIRRLQNAEYPFITARQYLDQLKADPSWSAGELKELRLQVVRDLLGLQDKQERVLSTQGKNLDVKRA